MIFNEKIAGTANHLIAVIRQQTATIGEGESAAIVAWWVMICDHAKVYGLEPKALAMAQLEAFLADNPVEYDTEEGCENGG